jgi:hypothetical protein
MKQYFRNRTQDMKVIKQNTSQVLSFGPFLDKTDGVTLITDLVSALDHGTTGIKLSKNGGVFTIRQATVTASVYDNHGCYRITLNSTDTNTLGLLRVMYTDAATCLPVWEDCLVVPANIRDALANSDVLQVDVAQWLNAVAPAMTGDAYPGVATLLSRIASALTITDGKVNVNDKTGFSIAGTKQTLDSLNDIAAAAVWAAGTRTLTSFGSLVADIATAVWGAGSRVLTGFGTLAADAAAAVWASVTRSLTDKAGFTIAGTKQTLDVLHDAAQGATKAELDAAQAAIEAAVPDISALALEDTLTAIKGAGWTDETLVALMAAILDRLATSGYTDPDNTGISNLVARLTSTRAGYLDNLSAGAVALEVNVQDHVVAALTAYDSPTRSEAAADKEEIMAAIPAEVDLSAITALLTRALGLAGENMVMDQTVFDADHKLTAARVRIYDCAAHALAAGDTGLISTFPLTMTWVAKLLETMTQVKS